MQQQDYILFLPRWYPNDEDPQLGVFIQKQAKAVAQFHPVVVLYVQKKDQLEEDYKLIENKTDNLLELTIQFKTGKNKVSNLKRFRNAQKRGFAHLEGYPSICHVHVPVRSSFLAQSLKKKKQIPFVITEHWSGFLNGKFEKKGTLYKWMYQSVAKKARQMIVVSEVLQKAFIENDLPKPVIVPNIIDTLPGDIEKENIVLTVGDLVDSTKNISGIINAFSKWKSEAKSDFQLYIIGGGKDEEKLKKIAADSSFSGEIKFLGRLENKSVLSWMQKAKIYVCNSNFETFGVTVGEAITAGCPVICSQCQGPEQFINKNTGLLIPKNDENALKESLDQIARSLEQYNPTEMTQIIEEKYSSEAVGKQLMDIYRSIYN